MAETTQISISISFSSVITKMAKHLAVIGKRAKDATGKPLFSDLTVSDNEKAIFNDLIASGAETIVNALAPFCSTYDNDTDGTITFTINSVNWYDKTATAEPKYDITKALEEAVYNYLYNFALAQYLSIIHPSYGDKYPPLFAQTYISQCNTIMQNIVGLCNIKRLSAQSNHSYKEVGFNDYTLTIVAKTVTGTVISDAAITINGIKENPLSVPKGSTAYYTVSASGYTSKSGNVVVNSDTTLNVQLIQTPS